jgi:hypothetical protein
MDIDANSNIVAGGSTADTDMISGSETPLVVLYQSDG